MSVIIIRIVDNSSEYYKAQQLVNMWVVFTQTTVKMHTNLRNLDAIKLQTRIVEQLEGGLR